MAKDIVNAVKKYPSLVITLGVVIFIAELFNRFVPVMTMIVGIVNMTGGDILDSILAILHLLLDLQNLPLVLATVAVIAILVSISAGLLLPGYLLAAIDGLDDGPRKKGLYREGIRKYFLRFFHMTLRVVLLAFLLLVFLIVSTVPGIVMTRVALKTSPELMVAAVFIDIVTVGVIFASLLFFSVYTYMWYIASLVTVNRPFRLGKQVADHRFWSIALGLLIFDVIFAGGFFIIFMIGNQTIKYAVGWVFATAFFTTLALYLVKFFKNNFN
ncbi:MAG TPA: hypothetical protein PK127_08240 [Clostridiales bacterium]|nr:hypothetical protein [Clostridiales bacterium]HPV02446.1 hypothetical protein [Clostridiales bacterium]